MRKVRTVNAASGPTTAPDVPVPTISRADSGGSIAVLRTAEIGALPTSNGRRFNDR
jgi:hypothetical protein